MRDYGKAARRLNFRLKCDRSLRAQVFRRDGFRCTRCGACCAEQTEGYDGGRALKTSTTVCNGKFKDILVVDHVVPRRFGGSNDLSNLQTLCETCNKRKQRDERRAHGVAA